MTNRDVCFLGFLALAYLYLEQRTELRHDGGRRPLVAGRPLEIRIVPRNACPRDETHAVSLRHDGAMWCRRCDEAYYPRMAEWEAGAA